MAFYLYRFVLFSRVPNVSELRQTVYFGMDARGHMQFDTFQDFYTSIVGGIAQITSEACEFYKITADESIEGDKWTPFEQGTIQGRGLQPVPYLPVQDCACVIGRTLNRHRFCRKWFSPLSIVHQIDGTLDDDMVQLCQNFIIEWIDGLHGEGENYMPYTGTSGVDFLQIVGGEVDRYLSVHRSRDPRYRP